MEGIDISQILEGVNNLNTYIDNTITGILSGNKEAQAVSDQQQATAKDAGDQAAIIEQQKAEGFRQAQENARRMGTALGVNMDDPSEIATKLGARIKDESLAMLNDLDNIQRRSTVDSFWNNPLQALKEGLSGFSYTEDFERRNKVAATATAALTALNTAAQQTAKTQVDLAKTATVDTVNAVAKIEADKAQERSLAYQAQAIQMNVNATKDVTQWSQQKLQNSVQSYSLIQQDESRKLQRESLDASISERIERLKNQQQTDEDNKVIADSVRKGSAVLYGKPLNIPDSQILKYLTLGNETGEKLRKALDVGQNSDVFGQPVISSDPGKAAATLMTVGVDLPVEMKTVQQTLESAVQAASQEAQLTGIKDGKQVQELVSRTATTFAENQAKNIKHNDFSNMYMAPSVATVASNKAVASSKFYKTVVEPQATAGMTDTDPQKLLNLALVGIRNGSISLSDAQLGLTLYFQAAVAFNNSMKDYSRVGLPLQKNYTTSIYNGVTTKPVDMTDSVQVSNVISKQMAKFAEQQKLGIALPVDMENN